MLEQLCDHRVIRIGVPEVRLHLDRDRGHAGRIDRIRIPLDPLGALDAGLGDAPPSWLGPAEVAIVSVLVSVGVGPDPSSDRPQAAGQRDHPRRSV